MTELLLSDTTGAWRRVAEGLDLDQFVALSTRLEKIEIEILSVSCINHWARPTLSYSASTRTIRELKVRRDECFSMRQFALPLGGHGSYPWKGTHLEVPAVEWEGLRAKLTAPAPAP